MLIIIYFVNKNLYVKLNIKLKKIPYINDINKDWICTNNVII